MADSRELRDHIMVATKACLAALRAHVDSKGYVSGHHQFPASLNERANGMPSVNTALFGKGAPDYTSVFRREDSKDSLTYILYEDVPELVAFYLSTVPR